MTKHTPGPWECGQHPAMSRGWIVRPALFGPKVFTLPECEGGHVVLKSEADARLIAAAPEMYEALEPDLIEAIAHVCERMGWDERFRILKDISDKQRQAKAKAEGATP